MNKPEFRLQRVYSDGTSDPPQVYPLLDIPFETTMQRRGFIGAGLVAGAVLSRLCRPANAQTKLPSKIHAHIGAIQTLAVSPNGKILVSAAKDKKIKVWSLPDGKLRHTLSDSTGVVEHLLVTPDSSLLATASQTGAVKLWSLETGRLQITLEEGGNARADTPLALTPDGTFLAAASQPGLIQLWSLPTGQLHITFTRESSRVRALAITPDGKTLVSGASDAAIALWSLPNGNTSTLFEGHASEVKSLSITPESNLLVSASTDKSIKLWSLLTNVLITTLEEKADETKDLAITPDGKLLVSNSVDGIVKLWSLVHYKLLGTLKSGSDTVTALVLIPQDKLLATGLNDKTIRLWTLPVPTTEMDPTALSGHGSATLDFRTWTNRSGKYTADAQLLDFTEHGVQLKKNDGRVVTVPLEKLAALDQDWVSRLFNDLRRINEAQPGDQIFRTWTDRSGKYSTEAQLLNLEGNEVQLKKKTGDVVTVLFDQLSYADREYSYRANTNEMARKRGVEESPDPDIQSVRTLEGHTCRINALAVTPDGKLLASADSCGVIALWDLSKKSDPRYLFDPAAVDGKASSFDIVDTVTGQTITYTLPCGSPIPPGATCTCNCVPGTYRPAFVTGSTVPTHTTRQPIHKTRQPATAGTSSGGGSYCTCVPVCICMAVPVCQAHRLLHRDPVVRAMANQLLLVMGRAERAYMIWAAQWSHGPLRARILEVMHLIDDGAEPDPSQWPTTPQCVERLRNHDEIIAIMAAQTLWIRQVIGGFEIPWQVWDRVQNLTIGARQRPWYMRKSNEPIVNFT